MVFIAAYLVTCLVAAMICYLSFSIGYLVKEGTFVAFETLRLFATIGTFYIAITAWPGFLVTHGLLWTKKMRFRSTIFALAGGLTTIQALLVLSLFVGKIPFEWLWSTLPAGVMAALVYWACLKRFRWLRLNSGIG